MKKTFNNFRTLAALLMAGAAFAACSSDDNIIENQQPANPGGQVYTLTINASKGDATTRALDLDGTGKLTASWTDGDELGVINLTKSYTPLSGTLTASNASGSTATFSGTLSGTIDVDDQLILNYQEHDYFGSEFKSQDGTLKGTNGAEKYDCANAIVTVASVDGSGNITISESAASFTTHTAMLKLTLQDGSSNALNATSLTISVGSEEFYTFTPTATTYTANGDGILYFAMPSAENVAYIKLGATPETIETKKTELAAATVTFTATAGGETYVATKTGYPFAAGKYYATTLTMAKVVAYSSEMNVPAGDHWYIGGSGTDNITIGEGATVTIGSFLQVQYASIICSGNATIILADGTTTNILNGRIKAGPEGTTLTIKGNTGELNIHAGNSSGAAIGASDGDACGNIVIQGGVITATGSNGAGIGASTAACGNITISGGTITATGSNGAAGIGGGYSDNGYCGNITISGGTVTAIGGTMAAGIGTGEENGFEGITISGGTVEATGGNGAAGIGGGNNNGYCGDINITSGVTSVTATKGSGAPNSIGAGAGDDSEDISVTIEDPSKVTQN